MRAWLRTHTVDVCIGVCVAGVLVSGMMLVPRGETTITRTRTVWKEPSCTPVIPPPVEREEGGVTA
jgi:hypothetical protein